MTRKPDPDEIKASKVFQLWIKGLKVNTQSVYGHYLARLLRAAEITPEQVLEEAKNDLPGLWRRVKPHANTISSEKGRYTALYALRRFLIDNGYEDLPPARIIKPRRVKPRTYLTWDQGLAICAAASRPYNLIFKLMLYCGWGIGEFLHFNRQETWARVKSYLASNPSAEYFRHDYPPRKINPEGFYSLVPTLLLKEIISLGVPVPLCSKGRVVDGVPHDGVPLDMEHYHSAGQYMGSAFSTALQKAPITVQGKPTAHDLRDTFRTRAEFVACSASAAEFVMGHQIDPLEYNKCYHDERWVWNELKKLFGPAAVTEQRIEGLERRIGQAISTSQGKPEALMSIAKILDAFRRGEGPPITKSEIAEATKLVAKLNELAEIMQKGEELNLRGQVEALLAEEKAKELIVKFYKAMKSEPPTTSKVKKLDFNAIVHPKRKRS